MEKIDSIILRFRDLLIDTIEEHKAIITKENEVWWGWWSKPQEKIPMEVFAKISNDITKKNFFDMYLFDSGKNILYYAKCAKIEYGNSFNKIKTPDKEKTPIYYNTFKYYAWFKLVEIRDILEDSSENPVLKKYTYTEVNDFFCSGKSPFELFDEKIVYSYQELAEQQRTIWFIRKSRITDKAHEIHSYIIKALNNIDENYTYYSGKSILWLSDLHFSEKHHAFNESFNKEKLSVVLNKSINKLDSSKISTVIVSGDLTFEATKEEFDTCIKFFKDLKSIYGIELSKSSMCPGNHDIKFTNKESHENVPIQTAYDDAKMNYVEFYRSIFEVEPEKELFMIRKYLVEYETAVEIISINSNILQQEENHFQGMGFVGAEQIRKIEAKLNKIEHVNPKLLRILVMHHHLVPNMFREEPQKDFSYSITLDSPAISQFIKDNKIRIVLHGHSHKEFCQDITIRDAEDRKYTYTIVGLGSTGAIVTDISDVRTNMFGLINISKNTVEIVGYSIYPNGEDGKEIFKHIINLEE